MLRPAIAVSTATLLLTLLPAQRYGRGDGQTPKLEHFTFEEGTLKSDKLKAGETGYAIYLPKEYADAANKDLKFPWIVWLHGFGGDGEFQGGGGAAVLDKLRGENKIPPLAMVIFRAPKGRTTYLNGEAAGDVEDFIAGDFVTQLVAKYRLATERAQRAVMGVSMGGMGALNVALHHPEVFGTVAVHSAAILPLDPAELPEQYRRTVQRMTEQGGLDKVLGNPVDKAKWQQHMPLGIVSTKKPEDLKGLHIYFDAGTDDRYGFCSPNESLDKAMTAQGIVHLFRKVEGGGHAWSSPSMKECLAVSLQFVAAALQGKDPIAACAPKAEAKPAEAGGEPKKGEAK